VPAGNWDVPPTWDAWEDGTPSTQDAGEGGASIRVHGEPLVVLEHGKASGIGGGREDDDAAPVVGVQEENGWVGCWVGTNRASPIP
jgi:hypothetical protein